MSGPETFEEIDWDVVGSRRTTWGRRRIGLLAVLATLAALFVYDVLVATPRPTVSVDVAGPLVGVFGDRAVWDVTQLDWLFMLTLVALAFYVVVPMYDNPRLTRHYWREFRRNRLAVASLGFLVGIFVVGMVGPLVLPRPELDLLAQYQPPVYTTVDASVPIQCTGEVVDGRCRGTWAYPLGTTADGKDLLVLVVLGMQVSMKIGLISALLVVTIGTAVGTLAAYRGGLVDEVLMRYVDIQLVFPAFFLYLLLIYLFGGSLFLFILVFGLTSWGGVARLVRSEALQRNEEPYVLAARGAGANTRYVIRRHLVPNVSSTVITAATLLIPGFILFEAALSFLTLGDPSVPSWGQVIANGRSDLATAWWISTLPGFFLFFTILAFNFVGDALRDALDPRSEH
jgi:peptide/nickel transport system permease protein